MLQTETVAIPFAQGVNPSSRARLLDQMKLLVAQNCHFPFDQGPEKRLGHTEREVASMVDPTPLLGLETPAAPSSRANFSTEVTGISDSWLYGFGLAGGTVTGAALETSDYPAAGNLYGQFTRDGEVVAWNGHRLFSYAPDHPDAYATAEAVMPALKAASGVKTNRAQLTPDMAENAVLRTTVWIEDGLAMYSVQSIETGAMLVPPQSNGMSEGDYARVVTTGPWTHILVYDNTTNFLEQFSFHQDEPLTLTNRTIGVADFGEFDVRKSSETRYIIGRIELTGIPPEPPAVQPAGLIIHVMEQNGSEENNWNAGLGTGTAPRSFGICPNRDELVGVAWEHDNGSGDMEAYFGSYDLSGFPYSDATKIVDLNFSQTSGTRITIADRYAYVDGNDGSWSVFFNDAVGAANSICVRAYTILDHKGAPATFTLDATRWWVTLASHATRVGNRCFVWTAYPDNLQLSYLLMDEVLKPVGKLDFGTAYYVRETRMPGINFTGPADLPRKDRMVFHGAMGYRQRVDTSSSATSSVPNGVWAEPSIRVYHLDFLPRLSSAQVGRAAMVAGAQLWSYDGVEANEATFHLAPPAPTSFNEDTGGSLTTTGIYRYRIALAYKNAHNEEIRSFSLASNEVTLTLTNNKLTLTIPSVPTRRENSYFLIFRTESTQTNYYLVSSRDPDVTGPNGFVRNDLTAQNITFDDILSDGDLLLREAAPENAANVGVYLDPLPAPACEIVAAGKGRLWLAGGELTPGEVAPSRLFFPNEQPTYSPALNIQVDRGIEPITAIGFMGDIGAIFRERATYVLDSDGLDNTLSGTWAAPRLALAELGAKAGTAPVLGMEGLYFQSPTGLRLLGAGGALAGWGEDMDALARDGDYIPLVVPEFTQVRYYNRLTTGPSLVYDYKLGQWCTWTVSAVGASMLPSGRAILALPRGAHWVETDGLYTDGDRPYEMVVRTANLHPGNAGDFWRVRRWVLFGRSKDLTLRVRHFYDDAPYHGEEISVALVDGNGDTWGNPTGDRWQGSNWGDISAPGSPLSPDDGSALWFRDGLMRVRKRPARQKCSVWSVEFSDGGAMNAGFSPYLLAVELGRKTGVDRAPGAT